VRILFTLLRCHDGTHHPDFYRHNRHTSAAQLNNRLYYTQDAMVQTRRRPLVHTEEQPPAIMLEADFW